MSNHASAVLRWWEQVQKEGGLGRVSQSATVSTMLFGCYRSLEEHTDSMTASEASEISRIRDELHDWMSRQGKVFKG